MKRIFILFALALSSMAAMAATYTVYYDNSGTNWSSVYVWIWNNTTGSNYTGGSKPQAMTSQGNNLYSYSFTTTEDVSNVGLLFCSSDTYGNQTGNFTFADGETYDHDGPTNATHYTHIVYFDNSSSNWSAPHCWIWDDNGNYTGNGSDDADGEPMTLVDGSTTLYYYEFITTTETLTNPYIIFSADANWGSQTANLVFVDGATYNSSGAIISGGDSNSSGEEVTYTVYLDITGVTGTWTNPHVYIWTTSKNYTTGGDTDGLPMTKVSDTLYSFTFTTSDDLTGAKVIFSADDNWTNQTDDLTFENGKTYSVGTSTGETTEGTYTIYFDASDTGWSSVYFYVYDNINKSTTAVTGDYPGIQATSTKVIDGTTYYVCTFTPTIDMDANSWVIFSNGTSDEENHVYQTHDLPFHNTGLYTFDGYTGHSGVYDDNWVIFFDASTLDNVSAVKVHMWHYQYDHSNYDPSTGKDDDTDVIDFTYDMTYDTSVYADYWYYSFYSDDANLTNENVELEFTVTAGGNDTKYPEDSDNLTTAEKGVWIMINKGVYGPTGFVTQNYDKTGYTMHTIYYKQSTGGADSSWDVHIWVYEEILASDGETVEETIAFTESGAWPGDLMTYIGDGQWKYTFYAPTGATIGLDFNDGGSWNKDNLNGTTYGDHQTSNMLFADDNLYEYFYNGSTIDQGNISGSSTYEVGAEIFISTVGYSTYYGDKAYVMPRMSDNCGNTSAANAYYFKNDVHGTAVTKTGVATDDDDESLSGYAKTDWNSFGAGSIVPAHTALILHSQKSGSNPDDAEAGDTDIDNNEGFGGRYYLARVPTEAEGTGTALESNLLDGSSVVTLTNVNGATTGYKFYMLSTDENGENLGFYYGADGGAAFASAANKAWLAVSNANSARLTSFLIEEEPDNFTTGITTVAPAKTVKSDAIYTLQGMRVSDMTRKGIYIVGGRKVVVR